MFPKLTGQELNGTLVKTISSRGARPGRTLSFPWKSAHDVTGLRNLACEHASRLRCADTGKARSQRLPIRANGGRSAPAAQAWRYLLDPAQEQLLGESAARPTGAQPARAHGRGRRRPAGTRCHCPSQEPAATHAVGNHRTPTATTFLSAPESRARARASG